MTAPLLLAPTPAPPVAPVEERVTCESCWESFPPMETRCHPPTDQTLCLDCLYAAEIEAEDRRAFFDYRRGC